MNVQTHNRITHPDQLVEGEVYALRAANLWITAEFKRMDGTRNGLWLEWENLVEWNDETSQRLASFGRWKWCSAQMIWTIE